VLNDPTRKDIIMRWHTDFEESEKIAIPITLDDEPVNLFFHKESRKLLTMPMDMEDSPDLIRSYTATDILAVILRRFPGALASITFNGIRWLAIVTLDGPGKESYIGSDEDPIAAVIELLEKLKGARNE